MRGLRIADCGLRNVEWEKRELAMEMEYVADDIIPAAYEDDAIHIAAAVLSGQDVLVSWNFRHLVNRRRSLVNLLNASRGLPTVEILSPPEL